VLPFTLLVVLASSISGDQHFFEIVTLSRPSPHQDWGRAKTAGNHFARDDKEPGSSWGKHLPGERPRETAETHVRRKGAAPLSGAEEKTARAISAHAQCACLLSLQMVRLFAEPELPFSYRAGLSILPFKAIYV
jgi:hypothetical protein